MSARDNHKSALPPPPLAGEGGGGGKPRWFVNLATRKHARALRFNSTDAERTLWRELRGHRLYGLGFRRQTPIGPYIVDFVSHEAKLVIEIDGGQHFLEKAAEKDAKRTSFLLAKGYRVLRFTNFDVLKNRDGVLSLIVDVLKDSPSLTLPRKRGRENEFVRLEQVEREG